MKDLAQDTFIQKWPVWLRWVLFIPGALVGVIIANLGVLLFFSSGGFAHPGWDMTNSVLHEFVKSFTFGFILLTMGAVISPSKQIYVAISILTFVLLLVGFLLALLLIAPDGTLIEGLYLGTNAIGALAGLYFINDYSEQNR